MLSNSRTVTNVNRAVCMTAASSAPSISPALDRVSRGDLCAGCGACAFLAPGAVEMRLAPPGYLRPIQTGAVAPETDRRIASVCPGLVQRVAADGRKDDILWGPYVTVETAWSTDRDIRHAGSSGGVLTAILVHLLDQGLVDGVVQVAASPEMPTANITITSRARSDVIASAGSRYAPSAPLANLREQVGSGQRFAFVGKPCDAAALRALCNADRDVAAAFPIILSFYCAGVPSLTGASKVLDALGTDPAGTKTFRYRGNGWPGRATAILTDGTERSMTYHESWGKILSKHVQHRCKICADGTGAAADIVCADAWESDAEGYPVFTERDGVSLLMARTNLGREIINAARARNAIATEPFDIATLAAIQPGQRERRRALAVRLAALRLLGRPVPVYRGLRILAAGMQNSPGKNIRNFLGTLRRAIKRRP